VIGMTLARTNSACVVFVVNGSRATQPHRNQGTYKDSV